ncbi:hypothetical protein BD289DRAFT_484972 [Coniella lustricola]|uniref:Uncharacterized protein n=1 Tax=Coniella lustricola TaxID=2025994 RepID=A0A2T3A086_9PEZI|nr:hypothetical protein BD289DRAFT_484972 [Coniella lustricola]
MTHHQDPVAIIGFACRLPGGNDSPEKLWQFLEQGGIASRDVPETRYNLAGHYDASLKPGTNRPPGGMFLQGVDPADFDASFFEISGSEAVSMDPNQRQMLEVVFESLENAGLTLERVNGSSVACFVGSFATDYGELQNRDPLDRAPNHTIGIGRASMANRISYFLNVKGPSVTIDTACSGSMVGLHLAVKALHNREAEAAIVATSNMYLNPEHVQDVGSLGMAHSPTGLCHTFDVTADGYVKSEAVSGIIVKRLADALRDGDPIRGVIRGTASTSNGRTNGIAQPSSKEQAAAVRQAYATAGITDLNATAYLECHGTGTPAGDPIEVNGIGSVFAPSRAADKPLIIGSIKSNIGHSEPSAGSSGVIKTVLSIEKGLIPGTPSFINPNPKIDFVGNKVRASRNSIPWPDQPGVVRRASVNSFGYGGSNSHAIIEQAPLDRRAAHVSSYVAEQDLGFDDFDGELEGNSSDARPYTLVVSANDATSLSSNVDALCKHLVNPRVHVSLEDLAYTLSERRTGFFHRAFVTTRTTEIFPGDFSLSKKNVHVPRIGFVFTGQGAQWPQMGKDLVKFFPQTRAILENLDVVLQTLPNPPQWSLITELTESRTAEHLRQPEFSQPLVTALQICLLAVLEEWGIKPVSVVGHSSGEIAAAYTAGYLDRAGAIKAAFYRGRAAVNRKHEAESDVGMLAVGLGAETVAPFLEKHQSNVWIACFNSPSSLTISGRRQALETLAGEIKAAGHFARLLQVDLAYHSELMGVIGEEYDDLLKADSDFNCTEEPSSATMFSSVTASQQKGPTDSLYWKTNMVSPVRFSEALTAMISGPEHKPDFLIEIGPSGALAGPVSQVLKSLPGGANTTYTAAWSRGEEAVKAIFGVAGRMFNAGAQIDLARVNNYSENARVIVDLPNYKWNHSVKYWFENTASLDWRFKKWVPHDLIGNKVLGAPWQAPTWRKRLSLTDVPWLRDHAMGSDVLMPAAGFISMALEGMFQKHSSLNPDHAIDSPNQLAYRFRNIRFNRALVVDENKPIPVLLSLSVIPGSKDWHEFHVSTEVDGAIVEHCHGSVRVQDAVDEVLTATERAPLQNAASSKLWYKAQNEAGMGFGPAFQKITSIEATSGQLKCRTSLDLTPPKSKWDPQSYYPVHPAVLDACFQSVNPALVAGERSRIQDIMIPSILDDVLINTVPKGLSEGLALAEAVFTERGRKDQLKSYFGNISMHDPESGALIVRTRGLHITKLDVGPKADPHTFHSVTWKPDICTLTQDQLIHLQYDMPAGSRKIDNVLDLIAHKNPLMKVLEINLDHGDTSSLWFERPTSSVKSAYSKYDFASVDAKSLVSVEMEYESWRKTAFFLADPSQEALGLGSESTYDLVIIKTSSRAEVLENVLQELKPLLSQEAFTMLVSGPATTDAIDQVKVPPALEPSFESLASSDAESSSAGRSTHAVNTPMESRPVSGNVSPSPATSVKSDSERESEYFKKVDIDRPLHRQAFRQLFKANGVSDSVLEVDSLAEGGVTSFLARLSNSATSEVGQTMSEESKKLIVFRLDDSTPELSSPIRDAIEASGWTIEQRKSTALLPSDHAANMVVLVLDELFSPVLTRVDGAQWDTLKSLIGSGTRLLWVTKGAQHDRVTDPDRALVHGLFRVARREDPTAKLTVLDVQSGPSPATAWAIRRTLDQLWKGGDLVETEYVERDGLLHIQRVVPDMAVNTFRKAEVEGLESAVKGLHETDVQVRIHGERVGTLDFAWCEEEQSQPDLEPDFVEVEVKTVGVNFKDVATTMGIVPENEFTIGCECAGVVRRLGPNTTKFNIGDRVVVMSKGTYANRVRVPAGRAHIMPSWMSFEDAATIPLVYMTALYSLFNLGGLKEGQSVLIHSAAGGVGLAAIQLAQYKKAEIFVTVGTDEKRELLTQTYGIPPSHIFSSRNTKFAEQIMKATNGRGVDVILNSLIGELLDASWRICADGGTMVEIGKRDIVDRNSLSMEPFDRNCSFRAIDLSYTKHFTPEVSAKLLAEVFDLVEKRQVGPIHPITTYGFDAVPAALAYIRRGQHIGKIVITNGDADDVQLPIRPMIRQVQLQPDVSYLIVGGLKGLCGSLAIHMAYHGARHIIACSRSGLADEASARIVRNCHALGCEITEARGDVADGEFVRSTFKNAQPRIAGVIQGAMVLRDKPYETMTVQDYHTAIEAKVQGTWNLHRASTEVLAQSQPLDFFTMLSSVSGVIGNKGQANYAAGNTFLDAFASYRRELGLAANTVDLGAIQDVGYVAEVGSSLESRFDTSQWTPINEAVLRRILSYSILQQDRHQPINAASAAQLITGIAYPLKTSTSDMVGELRFSFLFGGGDDNDSAMEDGASGKDEADKAARAFRLMVEHAAPGADKAPMVQAAVALFQAQIIKVMRLETEVEPGKPLAAYGLDSLSAVELRGWARTKLGAELSTLDITNAASVVLLCEKMVEKVLTKPT